MLLRLAKGSNWIATLTPAKIVRGLYTTLAIAAGVGLSFSLLAGIVLAFAGLPLDLAGVPTGWITWFLKNVVLVVGGGSLVILLGRWVAIPILYALERVVVWLASQIREAEAEKEEQR